MKITTNMTNLELEVKSAARDAFEEVLEGRVNNVAQENVRLKFISASAKYLRILKTLEYARNHPEFGFPPPRAQIVK